MAFKRRRCAKWPIAQYVLAICVFLGFACQQLLAQAPDEEASATAVSERIDAILDERLQQAGITPAPPAGDAEFFRRAYLDLGGVIPSASEVSAFLADRDPDKRAKLIDRLLDNPRFVPIWRRFGPRCCCRPTR